MVTTITCAIVPRKAMVLYQFLLFKQSMGVWCTSSVWLNSQEVVL